MHSIIDVPLLTRYPGVRGFPAGLGWWGVNSITACTLFNLHVNYLSNIIILSNEARGYQVVMGAVWVGWLFYPWIVG